MKKKRTVKKILNDIPLFICVGLIFFFGFATIVSMISFFSSVETEAEVTEIVRSRMFREWIVVCEYEVDETEYESVFSVKKVPEYGEGDIITVKTDTVFPDVIVQGRDINDVICVDLILAFVTWTVIRHRRKTKRADEEEESDENG